ncbi:MAG: phosphocholine cytidylyltransferase family protein [Clostridia bacterium]|nr:phosphocholine cytidylyltransferase family protein [Clostridia bacterium]
MKAVILAAGKGQRLQKYASGMPKGMLNFAGKALIEWQVNHLRDCGISDISVVTGYAGDKIKIDGIKYYKNLYYDTTNMVASLMCCSEEFNDDILICYADILYERRLIRQIASEKGDYVVLADIDWKNYWQMRYGQIDFDIESFKIDEQKRIINIGQDCQDPTEIDARYIGLLKFSKAGIDRAKRLYNSACEKYGLSPWGEIKRCPQKAYMTDLLEKLISLGEEIHASLVSKGWVEFDTNEDYELLSKLWLNNDLYRLIDLNK